MDENKAYAGHLGYETELKTCFLDRTTWRMMFLTYRRMSQTPKEIIQNPPAHSINPVPLNLTYDRKPFTHRVAPVIIYPMCSFIPPHYEGYG